MLPLGGVMVAGFVGWKLVHRLNPESIGVTSTVTFAIWGLLLRYVLPLALIVCSQSALGSSLSKCIDKCIEEAVFGAGRSNGACFL